MKGKLAVQRINNFTKNSFAHMKCDDLSKKNRIHTKKSVDRIKRKRIFHKYIKTFTYRFKLKKKVITKGVKGRINFLKYYI